MSKFIKQWFGNDKDGFSMSDYISTLFTGIFILSYCAAYIIEVMYQGKISQMAFDLIEIVMKPLIITILLGYFGQGAVQIINKKTNGSDDGNV